MKISKLLESKQEVVGESTAGSTSSGSISSVSTPVGGMQRRGKGSMFAGIKTSAKYPNSEAVKEEQINEVDPRNFDSDVDYYAARNAPAKARSHSRPSPGVNQDDEAYFREIFRKKRLAAQQAERSADHDRLATGTNEGEEMGTFAALKDWQVWDVTVMNNYYRGKYADYGARYYSVVASSPEEARQVVLNNADYVLQDLLSRKLQSGKKVLPRGSALPIEEKRVGDAKPGSITTMGLKKMLTPDGVQSFKFTNGKIVDGSHMAGGEEQGVAEDSPLDRVRQRVQSQGFTASPEERNDDRLANRRRWEEKLDKIHSDFINRGNVSGEVSDVDRARAQHEIDVLAYRLEQMKRNDDDWERTFDMMRDRINRYQWSSQRDVDPEQLAAISNIKYEPRKKATDYKEVDEGITRAVDAKGRTQQQWIQAVYKQFPDARIAQAKMIDGPCQAMLPDGRKLSWNKVEQGVEEARASTASFRQGNAQRAEVNAMSPEERKAHEDKRAEQQRKRDDARMERERQRNAAKKGVAEASFDYTMKDLGNDYAGFPSNHSLKHKFLAKIKPEKQQLYKDKMNNMHEFDQLFQLFTVAKQRGDIIDQGSDLSQPTKSMGLNASLEQHADDKMKELGPKFKGVAEGGYPDVDHMPGLVNKYNRTPAKPTSSKKIYTDKKQWLRDVDDINHSVHDDNSEYIGQTGRSTVEMNGVPWAVWSDAKQKGYIDMGSMSEEKQRLDPKCWSGYKKQGTKMKGDTRVNNCVKVDEAEFTEDKLANDLYRDLQIFKKGTDKDIGSKAKDKEISGKAKDKDIVAKEDWQKTNKQDKTDGMSPKAVKAYRRENPGSKLKTAVTKKPSELKAGSKDANRRKSFCARMSGNKGPMKDENGEPTPKAKALKRWNC